MEIDRETFEWLASLGVLHPQVHVAGANAKQTKFTLTADATNAALSGHVCYLSCYYWYQRAHNGAVLTTAPLVGQPGEPFAPQTAAYNWSILTDVVGQLGLQLGSDHRDLIVSGDTRLCSEVLREVYFRLEKRTAAPPLPVDDRAPKAQRARKPPTGVKEPSVTRRRATDDIASDSGKPPRKPAISPPPVPSLDTSVASPVLGSVDHRRDGAMSVDSGLKRHQERERALALQRIAEEGIERRRKAFQAKVDQAEQEQRRKEVEERRAQELRDRIASKVDADRYRLDQTVEAATTQLAVFKEFQNRGAVAFCLELIDDCVERVLSGEAQEELRRAEDRRRRARAAAEERKRSNQRLVDSATGLHLPRGANHAVGMICFQIVESLVQTSMEPDARERLDERAAVRAKEKALLVSQKERFAAGALKLPRGLKHEVAKAKREEEEERQREVQERRIAQMRRENAERAEQMKALHEMERKQKELEQAEDARRQKKKQAQDLMYYATQKAKAEEHARQRKAVEEAVSAEVSEQERVAREERRKRGQELNRKIHEREVQRVANIGKDGKAPPTLSAFSIGTGEHAAYFGDTLGWQYLTEPEFDFAQVLCQVRSNPSFVVPTLKQFKMATRGQWSSVSDERGKRNTLFLADGIAGIDHVVGVLQKQPHGLRLCEDVSIGLTLAARLHATDMAYHGRARLHHVGTDGSSTSQRVQRFGSYSLRTGCAELVFGVVRPATVHLSPVDVVAYTLLGDGDPAKEAINILFSAAMFESIGVGHAVATIPVQSGATVYTSASFSDSTSGNPLMQSAFVVEVYVAVVAFHFIDKPVAWMAAAQHAAISAVAPPYLDGRRDVHPSLTGAAFRDLMSSDNFTIGRSSGVTNDVSPAMTVERLTRTTAKRTLEPLPQHDERSSAAPSAAPSPTKNVKSTQETTAPSKSTNSPPAEDQRPPDDPKVAAEKAAVASRLERFYTHYAPHKLPIIDSAIQLFEGRYEELFFTLVQKYGPEPPANGDAPPPKQPAPAESPAAQSEPAAAQPTTTQSTAQAAPQPTPAA